MDYKQLYDSVVAGNAPALQSYIQVKKYAEDLATYVEGLKELASQDFYEKWGGREQEISGVIVAPHKGGKYNYEGVPGWKDTKAKLSAIEAAAQAACKAGGVVVDEMTGEITTPAVFVPNKDGIAIKSVKPNKA